jgi:undecaprenyl phosphate N,N'-diacetylbacillosamine 1-phosphate transferase
MFLRKKYLIIKRVVDLVGATLLLLLLTPMMIVVSVLIKAEDGGPVFFSQNRVGKNHKIFKLYKFRSMTDVNRVKHVQTYSDSVDVTRIGQIIRRYKIDELPQLINVIKGNLSMVGPRPCLPETIIKFGDQSQIRHSVRPGLSGMSQINGNIYLSWEERLLYDLEYVNNMSLLLDLKIIFMTLYLIVRGEEKGLKSV